MPSFKTPTPQQIDIAMQRMRSPELYASFLSQLENPKWVAIFRNKGAFSDPPSSTLVEDRPVYPHWPASNYLARMAKHVPLEVAEIFSGMCTDNVLVIGDMITAALAMPAKEGAMLEPKIADAVLTGSLLTYYFKEASNLCVQLAEGGEIDAALNMAEALFSPKFEQEKREPKQIDIYWYNEGLKKVIPALVAVRPREFVLKSCDWLKSSIDIKGEVDLNTGFDGSWLWRPAIEEHGQNHDYDFTGVMVGFVRQAFEQAIKGNRISLDESLKIIANYSYLIFKRIRIHLINEFSEQNPELSRRVMMDKQLFDDHRYKHEYAMLAGRRLNLLEPQERDAWFSWVDAGPDMTNYDQEIRETLQREPTENDMQSRINYWKFEKLHIVRNHLEGKRKIFYETMLKEHDVPELADLNSYVCTRWGNESPTTVEELGKMAFEQAVEWVSSWVPKERDRFWGPEVEGLAETFGKYVATNPKEFSEKAKLLAGKPAIYVHKFISQMSEAIKSNKEINVKEVLRLCNGVLERPVNEPALPPKGNGKYIDKDWQWTWDAISELIQQICKAGVDEKTDTPKYSLEKHREQIWKSLPKLCKEIDSKSYIVHDFSKDDPRLQDYFMMGVNSARGKALEALLEYARWVANHIKKREENHEVVPGGFGEMPEVKEILQWQIAKENRSVTALAVIGAHISVIYWIDRDWLSSNSDCLFDLEDIQKSSAEASGWAAWNAFLSWNNPHIEYYNILKKQFAYTVKQSTNIKPDEKSHENPMFHLGEHLMILYGRGQLGFNDDDGLLKHFLSDAHPIIRRHAIGFVGSSLGGEEQIPAAIIKRFMDLWAIYWDGAGINDAKEKPDAFLFGTWFSSGKFPEQWALEQLENFVQVTQMVEPDHAVIEQLARVSPEGISYAVRILDKMIRGDQEGWHVYGWRDTIRQILKLAMSSGGDIRAQAEKTIDFLGRRGYNEFGELLKL